MGVGVAKRFGNRGGGLIVIKGLGVDFVWATHGGGIIRA